MPARLDELPNSMSLLRQLRELNITAGHTLEPLPGWLHQLPSLHTLRLDCNIQCGCVPPADLGLLTSACRASF